MSLKEFQTIEPIALDIYSTNIKTINAKQLDSKSRFVRISCTEHGKKIELDKDSVFAYIRYLKPDGKAVLNSCTVSSDGTVEFELTQQMLAVPGKATADIMLFEVKTSENDENVSLPEDKLFFHGIAVKDNDDGDVTVTFNHKDSFIHTIKTIEDLDQITLPLLSTMTLYVNVLPTTVNHAEIEKSPQFDELSGLLSKMSGLEALLTNAVNEADKATGKAKEATGAANTATGAANTAAGAANTATEAANTAAGAANTAAGAANTAAGAANTAAGAANTAAGAANTAAARVEKAIDDGGIAILDKDKKIPHTLLHIENNLLTDVEGMILDARQGKVLKDEIADLASSIEELKTAIADIHKVYYGKDDPNEHDVAGSRDGDIYMMIIKNANETAGE